MGAFRRAAARVLFPLLAAAAVPAGASEPAPPPEIDPVELVRRVVANQRRVEKAFEGATYDQSEVKISWDGKGRPSKVERRLFYVLAGESGAESTRELVEVDGRPATEEEKREAAEDDAKGRKKRAEQRAAARASSPPRVSGDEDDPLVGSRRLSELIGRYTMRVVGEEVIDGRPAYVLDFSPSPSAPAPKGLGDRALSALAGRVRIDAATFQIRSVEAHLTRPVKVAGGLAANVKDATVTYVGEPVAGGYFFPCDVDLHLSGKTALFFRLDFSFRAELRNLRRFRVETDSEVRPDAGPGSTP